ncbi:unnamed protein product [Cunninghamella echinulata]
MLGLRKKLHLRSSDLYVENELDTIATFQYSNIRKEQELNDVVIADKPPRTITTVQNLILLIVEQNVTVNLTSMKVTIKHLDCLKFL